MRSTFLLILISATALLFSCKNEAPKEKKQNQLTVHYFVRYLKPEGQLKAQASFFESDAAGNIKPKTFLGGISFQNSGMESKNLLGKEIRHTLTRKGDYSDAFTFAYSDDEGKIQKYTLAMPAVEAFFVKGKIIKSKGMTLVVKGEMLKKNQSYVLLFSDEKNQATSLTIDGPSRSIEYFIPSEKIIGLTSGKGHLYLVKKQNTKEEKDNISISAAIEYYSENIEVEVLE